MLYLQKSPTQILQEIKTIWALISIYRICRKQTPTKSGKDTVKVQEKEKNQQINNSQVRFYRVTYDDIANAGTRHESTS